MITDIGKRDKRAIATNGRQEPQTSHNLPNQLQVRKFRKATAFPAAAPINERQNLAEQIWWDCKSGVEPRTLDKHHEAPYDMKKIEAWSKLLTRHLGNKQKRSEWIEECLLEEQNRVFKYEVRF